MLFSAILPIFVVLRSKTYHLACSLFSLFHEGGHAVKLIWSHMFFLAFLAQSWYMAPCYSFICFVMDYRWLVNREVAQKEKRQCKSAAGSARRGSGMLLVFDIPPSLFSLSLSLSLSLSSLSLVSFSRLSLSLSSLSLSLSHNLCTLSFFSLLSPSSPLLFYS